MFYLMKEDGEEFWSEAANDAEAQDSAAVWNAVVIRKATAQEQAELEKN